MLGGDSTANVSALVIVAHPDDEVLGFGGTAHLLSKAGASVRACILSGDVGARQRRPSDAALLADTREASERLGLAEPILGSFPNIKMNTVPHLELVQFVEEAMRTCGANRLVTHHPNDVNDDHRQVSLATQAAARLAQRGAEVPRLLSLHFMEVPSSTDWAFAGPNTFVPDSFVELGEAGVAAKLDSLAAYRDVMRPYPHPRSVEGIVSLAQYRGAQAGMDRAEAFQTAFLDLGAVLS